MFKVKINNKNIENEYLVYGEGEVSFVMKQNHVMIPTPSYYNLEVISGPNTIIKFTNNEPVIIKADTITYDEIFDNYSFSFGINLSIREYEVLYELHLKQQKKQQTPEYQNIQKIKQDIEKAKKLVKNRA
mgnify:CR=1 FL=1